MTWLAVKILLGGWLTRLSEAATALLGAPLLYAGLAHFRFVSDRFRYVTLQYRRVKKGSAPIGGTGFIIVHEFLNIFVGRINMRAKRREIPNGKCRNPFKVLDALDYDPLHSHIGSNCAAQVWSKLGDFILIPIGHLQQLSKFLTKDSCDPSRSIRNVEDQMIGECQIAFNTCRDKPISLKTTFLTKVAGRDHMISAYAIRNAAIAADGHVYLFGMEW